MADGQVPTAPQPGGLQPVPVYDVGPDFTLEALHLVGYERGYAMLDDVTRYIPNFLLSGLDRISRNWLVKNQSPYLAELDAIADLSKRPGTYFLNVNYEWGCTTAAKPSPDGTSARLLRVLDWGVGGLGRHMIACRIKSAVGPWISLTWPGFTGVLQAMAPGRFAAAINQPGVKKRSRFIVLDWALGKREVWRSPHMQPVHLLRRVFEEAPDFATAKRMLVETPICAPVIYILAGVKPDEVCVIERQETSARVLSEHACAANEWQTDWQPGHFRVWKSTKRVAALQAEPGTMDLAWLKPPIFYFATRLALVADAAQGRMIAQGFERSGPATAVLDVDLTTAAAAVAPAQGLAVAEPVGASVA